MPSKAAPVIELDGSFGEGSGALFRTAILMATLTQQPVTVEQIRGATAYPGLDTEDLLILHGAAASCKAEVEGAEIGSHRVHFSPKRGVGKVTLPELSPRSKSRAANALVVGGALIPLMARSGTYHELAIQGETYGNHTLTYDYFSNVTLKAYSKMGVFGWSEQVVAGYGRESFGQIQLEVEPSVITGIDWSERGQLRSCNALVVCSELPKTIGNRATSHLERLSSFSGVKMHCAELEVKGSGPGCAITAWAEFERGIGGAVSVGVRSMRVESVAQSAFEALSTFLASDASVDAHLADQILLLSVFAEGPCRFKVPRLTRRLLTMIWVIKQFTPIHITVQGVEGQPGAVSISR